MWHGCQIGNEDTFTRNVMGEQKMPAPAMETKPLTACNRHRSQRSLSLLCLVTSPVLSMVFILFWGVQTPRSWINTWIYAAWDTPHKILQIRKWIELFAVVFTTANIEHWTLHCLLTVREECGQARPQSLESNKVTLVAVELPIRTVALTWVIKDTQYLTWSHKELAYVSMNCSCAIGCVQLQVADLSFTTASFPVVGNLQSITSRSFHGMLSAALGLSSAILQKRSQGNCIHS